jgi:hypothetical protein
MYTRSTDINRTIQSADAMIRGFAPNLTTFYPIIHSTAQKYDTLLLTDTAMSMNIPLAVNENACLNNEPRNFDQRFLNITFLNKVANFLNLSSGLTCSQLTPDSDINTYGNCILPMWDTIMSEISMGLLKPTDPGVAEVPIMESFDALKRKCLFVETSKEQGAITYTLVEQMIANMELRRDEALRGISGAGQPLGPQTKLLYEYSAHDTTIAPLMVALGYTQSQYLLPQFGQAIITELVNETTTGVLTLRYWYGQPNTIWPPANTSAPANATHYEYTWQSLPVICWDMVNNRLKNSTDSCTLDEFKAYAENVLKPTDPAGAQCYLSSDVKKSIKCNLAAAPTDPTSNCYLYRQACPQYACSDDFTIDTRTLACIPTKFVPVVSTGQAFAIASGTTVAGILLGVAATFIAKALSVPAARTSLSEKT